MGHNLHVCFRENKKSNAYSMYTPGPKFHYEIVRFKGVTFTRAYYADDDLGHEKPCIFGICEQQ